jgi:serine/threonine protein kinase
VVRSGGVCRVQRRIAIFFTRRWRYNATINSWASERLGSACTLEGSIAMIGRKLGHNRIVEKIGEGGMGAVYRAEDEHLGRSVAIKTLPGGALSDESARRRFRKEALALSS